VIEGKQGVDEYLKVAAMDSGRCHGLDGWKGGDFSVSFQYLYGERTGV
jgi:hypothetical protein